MADTQATTSQGTQLKVKCGSPLAFTLIPYIMGFTGPSTQQDLEEITNLDSTGGYKEWFATLRDGGSVSFDMIAKAGDFVQEWLRTANINGTREEFELEIPFDTPETYTFKAYVTKFENKFAKGAAIKYGIEIKVTGPVSAAA